MKFFLGVLITFAGMSLAQAGTNGDCNLNSSCTPPSYNNNLNGQDTNSIMPGYDNLTYAINYSQSPSSTMDSSQTTYSTNNTMGLMETPFHGFSDAPSSNNGSTGTEY